MDAAAPPARPYVGPPRSLGFSVSSGLCRHFADRVVLVKQKKTWIIMTKLLKTGGQSAFVCRSARKRQQKQQKLDGKNNVFSRWGPAYEVQSCKYKRPAEQVRTKKLYLKTIATR